MRFIMNHTCDISRKENLDLEQLANNPVPIPLSTRIPTLVLSPSHFSFHTIRRFLHLHTRALLRYYTAKTSRSIATHGVSVNRNVCY